MINYKYLLAFTTVIKKKSFTGAAKELYMTQPAISWQIKNLENEIGLILIERKERGTKLTEAGKRFYMYAEKIIKAQEQLIEEMKQLKCMGKGRLLIGASTVPGEYILPVYINRFKEEYPSADVFILTGSSESICEQLLHEDIHIGVIGAKLEDTRIEFKSFKKDKVILIANNDHPLTKLREVTLEDIVKYPIVIREHGSGVRKIVEDTLDKYNYKLRHFSYCIELSGSRSGITAVKNSNSIAWVSNIVARDSIALNEVKEILVKDVNLNREIYLIRHKIKILSPLSEAFFNFILKQMDKKQMDKNGKIK